MRQKLEVAFMVSISTKVDDLGRPWTA